MSSTALDLVNKVLLLTGDLTSITTIVGSTGNIGERIIGFMNLAISDIENRANWPVLRVNAKGAADGLTDVMTFSGTEKVGAESPVSVWIEGQKALTEVTAEQFDMIMAKTAVTGPPEVFQRGEDSTGNLQIQIYPKPAQGAIVNISGYKKATRLTNSDTSTTELSDEHILYGALMHMDSYDGMDRGYAALFRSSVDGALLKLYSNANYQVMVDGYA